MTERLIKLTCVVVSVACFFVVCFLWLGNKPVVYPIGIEEVHTMEGGTEIAFYYAVDGKDSVVMLRDYDQLRDYVVYLQKTCAVYNNKLGKLEEK